MTRLMLISNSTLHGSGYLDHCAGAIGSFLRPSVTRVLFVPYALFDRDAYAAKARARFEAMGYGLDSVPSFEALALVPFNINPHYLDPTPGSTHMGETREQRIAEFHEENTPAVIGLREGAWLLIEDRMVVLQGVNGARLFRRGEASIELVAGRPEGLDYF